MRVTLDWRERTIRLNPEHGYPFRRGSIRQRCTAIIEARMDWRRRLPVRLFIQSAHQRHIATKQAKTALSALIKHKVVTLERAQVVKS